MPAQGKVLSPGMCFQSAEKVRAAFRREGFELVYVPAGCTSLCQPLDTHINKPFKAASQEVFEELLGSGNLRMTKGGNVSKFSPEEVWTWPVSEFAHE